MSRIRSAEVIPLAFDDPPLLNTWGVHEPLALRSLVRLVLADGTEGWGEAGGDLPLLKRMRLVARELEGVRVDEPAHLTRVVDETLGAQVALVQRNTVRAPFDVAAMDALGKLEGVPVVDLLGGAVRLRVDFSGYLFYKWAEHPGHRPDEWGGALDPSSIVALAHAMADRYGFASLKLKAGVFDPAIEVATIEELAAAFPGMPLRIDPNGAWSESTAVAVAHALEPVLDYLEDPVLGIAAMARVREETSLPLASNMTVNTHSDLDEVVRAGALDIVLADHHYWGGLRPALELTSACADAGLGVSMHSNSHLGVSLAAMTHVAAASSAISYASDTHYPWNSAADIVEPGVLEFTAGSLAVPTGPGLGVHVRHDAVERLHRAYLDSGRTVRDDTGYARSIDPGYDPRLPRF